MLGLTALVSAPFWAPLIATALRVGIEPLQNRWYEPWMAALPALMAPDLVGLVQLVGLAGCIYYFRRVAAARAIALLWLAVLGWNLVGYIGIMVDTPLLYERMNHLLLPLSIAGAAVALGQAIDWGGPEPWRRIVHPAAVCLVLVAHGQEFVRFKDTELYDLAVTTKTPDAILAPEVADAYAGAVFLTDYVELNAYLPVFYFINHNAHFAHPSSHFRERLKFVSLISRSNNPAFVAWMLSHNRFDAVDYVWFVGRAMTIYDDNFPGPAPYNVVSITFERRLFENSFYVPEPLSTGFYRLRAPDQRAVQQFSTLELDFE